jgi:hypothetical protein
MIGIDLQDLELYRFLAARDQDRTACALRGLLVLISGDAQEFLTFVRNRFPSYTAHDIQHSWRIVSRIESILTAEAKASLTSVEIFSFIVAAAFHDVGMASGCSTAEEVRRTHHVLSEQLLNEYMGERLSVISEYVPRLSRCIGFIIRAHGLTWDEMAASELFKRPEKLFGQSLRTSVLAILLRIGDLLDLDSDRSCDALRRHAPTFFHDAVSRLHHERHKHVTHFNYDSTEISISVEAHAKEEHSVID